MALYLRQKNWYFIRHSIVYNVEKSEINYVDNVPYLVITK